MIWKEELKLARSLALEAGKVIMEIYNRAGDVQMEYKEDRSPLTEADKAANQIIVHGLKSHFSHYAVLSEEEKDNLSRLNQDYCFIVDPLDGTKEFLKRNGQFTVNIALAYRREAVMGVIYVPAARKLYYAAKEQGAFLETEDGMLRKLSVSDNMDISLLRVVMSNSHGCTQMDELIKNYNLTKLVKVGSSLKGCMIAEGRADVYYRFNPTMEWDTAAMQCIVEEAGAIFRQMDGTKMFYNRENSVNEKGFYIINREENLLQIENDDAFDEKGG